MISGTCMLVETVTNIVLTTNVYARIYTVTTFISVYKNLLGNITFHIRLKESTRQHNYSYLSTRIYSVT